jgi:hypothetical protein
MKQSRSFGWALQLGLTGPFGGGLFGEGGTSGGGRPTAGAVAGYGLRAPANGGGHRAEDGVSWLSGSRDPTREDMYLQQYTRSDPISIHNKILC